MEVKQLDKQYFMGTFGERICEFVKGDGVFLFDERGNKYVDFFAGLAVNVLGHAHEKFLEHLSEQMRTLVHVSNLYYNAPQSQLAQKIVNMSCVDRVFFANSGAEANEGALKLALSYHNKKNDGKYEVISLYNSFHGRTLATTQATGQEKFYKPYRHIFGDVFKYVPANDTDSLASAVTQQTSCIIVELIQGESGVHMLDREYVKHLREICTKNDIVLIFDEVQTGIGRTGKWFAYEHYGVEPDIFTLAKALGGGVPIGALCAKEQFCAFTVGDHGTTFGGNPLACKAALSVLEIMEEEKLLENCCEVGQYLSGKLSEISDNVRGIGLMVGVGVRNAKQIQKKLHEKGFLVGSVGEETIRLLPPLILTKGYVDEFIDAFRDCI